MDREGTHCMEWIFRTENAPTFDQSLHDEMIEQHSIKKN
jgi:hypothetical protein